MMYILVIVFSLFFSFVSYILIILSLYILLLAVIFWPIKSHSLHILVFDLLGIGEGLYWVEDVEGIPFQPIL